MPVVGGAMQAAFAVAAALIAAPKVGTVLASAANADAAKTLRSSNDSKRKLLALFPY